jgi:hypothetical protein
MCALLNFQLLLQDMLQDLFLLDLFQDPYLLCGTRMLPTLTETFLIFGVIWKEQSQFIIASVSM